jgi:2-methylcitrate dehydratase PrpD
MPVETIAERLTDFILSTPFEAIPADLLRRVQAYLIDLLGASLAAVHEPSSRIITRVVLDEGSQPEATIFGMGRRASATAASLANGTIAHALELDDDHRLATLHPGAVVVPAALATVEANGGDGKTLLRAVLMGYEVMCRVGEAFLGRQFYGGFHPTGTCGVFGAAVAAGIALGLDRTQLVRALGIAGTQASGLGEWRADGSWIKRLHPGRAAQSGVLAARLAKQGFTGPATIFEGQDGFLRAFSYQDAFDEEALLRGLGHSYRAQMTAFKPYPGCRFAHAAIDLALDIVQDPAFRVREVESGLVRIYKTDILNYIPRPTSTVAAQFSVPYLLATALTYGRVTLEHLTDQAIRDSTVLDIADRIHVHEDAEFTSAYPEFYTTEVELTLKSGRRIGGLRHCPRGDPEAPEYVKNPGQFELAIEDKFRTLLAQTPYAPNVDLLLSAVKRLPEGQRIDDLTAMLAEPKTNDVGGRSI